MLKFQVPVFITNLDKHNRNTFVVSTKARSFAASLGERWYHNLRKTA